jgi:hypothetical protein
MVRTDFFSIFAFSTILDGMARSFFNGIQNILALRTELHLFTGLEEYVNRSIFENGLNQELRKHNNNESN